MVDGAGQTFVVRHDGLQIHLVFGAKTGHRVDGVFIGAVWAGIYSSVVRSDIAEVRVYVHLVLEEHLHRVSVAIPGVGRDGGWVAVRIGGGYLVSRMKRVTDVGEGNSHAGPLLAVRPLLVNVRLKSHGTRLRTFPGDLYQRLLVVFRGVVVRGIVYPEYVTLHREGDVSPVYGFRSGVY